jgi:hypothetical protein
MGSRKAEINYSVMVVSFKTQTDIQKLTTETRRDIWQRLNSRG